MPTLTSDTFTRANQSGWGTASSGDTWNQIDGTNTLAISSNEGTATGHANTNSMQLGTSTAKDVEGLVRTSISATAAKTGIELRVVDLNNHYLARINGSSTNKVEIVKNVSGTYTVLSSASFTPAANTFYWLRFRCQGTTLEAKAWADGSSEPGSWTTSVTDSTYSAAGYVALYQQASAGSTTTKFDSFTVTNLQHTLDFMARALLANATTTLDFMARARLAGTTTKDFMARARLAPIVNTGTKDFMARARLAGLGLLDFGARACVAETVQALPSAQANALTIKIANALVTVLNGSFTSGETLDGRSTCSFTVRDDSGAQHFQYRQPVTVDHSVQGRIFTGFVNTAEEENFYPNVNNAITCVCVDEHYIPDKRAYEGSEFVGQYAGDIAASLAAQLASDGVTATYAIDRDTTSADFKQGTLSGVTAAANVGGSASGDGDLELAPAGSTVTIKEMSQSAFAQGTLSSVTAASDGALELSQTQAIKLTGTCATNLGSNLYTYVKVWAGSVNIASGDFLAYDVWISSTSPKIMGGPDFVCTDGTTLRDSGALDQFQMSCHPNADLTGFADDQWFHRTVSVTSGLVGKTISYASVALEGDTSGTYTVYVKNLKLFDSGSNVKQVFFSTSMNTNQQLQNKGYYNVSAKQTPTFELSGHRVSQAYNLAGAGIYRTSLISWQETDPTQPTGGNQSSATPVLVESSWDGGATYQTCTNNQELPNMLAGTSLAGKALRLRETLTQNGPSPEVTPQLTSVQVTVEPSYAANKTDVSDTDSPSAGLSGGTLSNISATSSGNQITGYYRNWDNGDVTSATTIYGAGAPASSDWEKSLALRTGTGFDIRARLDGAGSWQNFIAEFDVQFPDTDSANYGLVYRTTGWQNANDTYAYNAFISNTGVGLGKGTNTGSGAGGFTSLGTVAASFTSGNWYHMKVVVSGNTHQIYVDDVLYVNISDSSYTAAGQIALRHYYNDVASRHSGFFDNFGIMSSAFSGTRQHVPLDMSAVGTVTNSIINWNATVPSNCTFLVEASVDGGNVWQTCTNGAFIPGVNPGYNVTGQSLRIRETYTTNNANATPLLQGMNVYIVGEYHSTGSRISPPLGLSAVGRVGSSLVAWTATLPNDSTTLGIDLSPDGLTWTDVSNQNGQPVPFLTSKQEPAYSDNFRVDDSASYTSSSIVGLAGATAATWAVDTVNFRLVGTGGTEGFFSPNGQSVGDGEIIFDTDYADRAGLMFRMSSDYGTCYQLSLSDGSGPRTPNQLRLYKVVSGQYTQMGLGSYIAMVRGIPTRFKVMIVGGTITITTQTMSANADGTYAAGPQTLVYTDTSPLSAGLVALRSNGGTNRYSLLRVQAYGDDVSNKSLYCRQRLTSTDPTATPQIQDLQVSVRADTIGTGALVPATTYSTLSGSQNSIAQDLDDLAKQSNYWWNIRQRVLSFMPTDGILAPFVVTNNDMLVGARVKARYNSDLYRNESVVIGGTDTQETTETYTATGLINGFPTLSNIDSLSFVVVNGQYQSFGLSGVDTGKQWYYTQGQQGITQDTSATPLANGVKVQITYNAQVQVIAKARNAGQIALLAALDGTSGVVTVVEQASGLSSDAAQQLALSRIQQYSVLALDLSFSTLRAGLHVGQLATVYLPQHGIKNQTFLITQVDYTPQNGMQPNGVFGLLETYAIQCTSGPVVGSWERLFS